MVETEVLTVDASEPDPEVIGRAAEVIDQGGLVVLPTDTVYGLACDPLNARAVESIYRVKARDKREPLALLLHDMGQATEYAGQLPERAVAAMQHFWPGGLTVVLRTKSGVTAHVRASRDTVGLRLPAHVVPRLVAGRLGRALVGTSANRSGRPAPLSAEEAVADFGGVVQLILDAGRCPLGQESTVLSFAEDPPRVLRMGAIPISRLREVIGEVREK